MSTSKKKFQLSSLAYPLLAALLLRLLLLLLWNGTVGYDAPAYVELGQRLAVGQGYTFSDGTPNAYRAPGLPFLLALIYSLFGTSLWYSGVILLLLDCLSVPLLYWLGRRLKDENAGRLAAWLWAIQPFTAFLAIDHHTDSIAISILIGLLLLYVAPKQWTFLGIGLLAGMLVWFRPVMQFLPGIILIERIRYYFAGKLTRKSLLITAIALLVGYSVATVPWMLRNYSHFGKFGFCYLTGVNFYIGWHAGANGAYSFNATDEEGVPGGTYQVERDSLYLKRGIDYITSHPKGVAALIVKKAVYSFIPSTGTYRHFNPVMEKSGDWQIRRLPWYLFVILTLLSSAIMVGGWYLWRKIPFERPVYWVMGGLVVLNFVTMQIFFANPRFRIPTDLIFVVFIAVFLFGGGLTQSGRINKIISWIGMIGATLATIAYFVRWGAA